MGQATEEAIEVSGTIEQGFKNHSPQLIEMIGKGTVHPDPQAQNDLGVNRDLQNSYSEAQDVPVDPEAGLSDHTNRQIIRPVQNTGRFRFFVRFILGTRRSDPIWRLWLLTTFIVVVFAMAGLFLLPGALHRVHATYKRVMLITSVAAPVAVAAISLFVSFWLPSERSNWITGLLVVNASLLGGSLVVYLALQQETRN